MKVETHFQILMYYHDAIFDEVGLPSTVTTSGPASYLAMEKVERNFNLSISCKLYSS